MGRTLTLLYGITVYAVFLGTFLYLIGFLTGLVVPRPIAEAPTAPLGLALLIDLGLLLLFGLQHSIMARPAFKQWWTRFVPRPVERSTFVLITCVLLGLIFWLWRAPAVLVWQVEQPVLVAALWGLAALGWIVVLASTYLIDHFDLFGLRQVIMYALGRPYRPPVFKESVLYRLVRHPLMLGFMVAFWATPVMTLSQLIFALGMTGYILVAVCIEERDLVRFHGEAYEAYQRRVPRLIPFLRPRAAAPATPPPAVAPQPEPRPSTAQRQPV